MMIARGTRLTGAGGLLGVEVCLRPFLSDDRQLAGVPTTCLGLAPITDGCSWEGLASPHRPGRGLTQAGLSHGIAVGWAIGYRCGFAPSERTHSLVILRPSVSPMDGWKRCLGLPVLCLFCQHQVSHCPHRSIISAERGKDRKEREVVWNSLGNACIFCSTDAHVLICVVFSIGLCSFGASKFFLAS